MDSIYNGLSRKDAIQSIVDLNLQNLNDKCNSAESFKEGVKTCYDEIIEYNPYKETLDELVLNNTPHIRISIPYFNEVKKLLRSDNKNEIMYKGMKVISFPHTSELFEKTFIKILNIRNGQE